MTTEKFLKTPLEKILSEVFRRSQSRLDKMSGIGDSRKTFRWRFLKFVTRKRVNSVRKTKSLCRIGREYPRFLSFAYRKTSIRVRK